MYRNPSCPKWITQAKKGLEQAKIEQTATGLHDRGEHCKT